MNLQSEKAVLATTVAYARATVANSLRGEHAEPTTPYQLADDIQRWMRTRGELELLNAAILLKTHNL